MTKWGTLPYDLALDVDRVHVWLFDLDNLCQEIPAWERLLSEQETVRSKRYRFERDRLRFITRRGILRQLLGEYTGLEPSAITYHTNPQGKLSLPFQPLKFNLSSCQNRVVFAFVMEKEIGVDLEQVHTFPELGRTAKYWLSPVEQAGLFTLAPEIQMEAFFHIWTQKEAFLKACGEGLSLPLQDFSVSIDPNLPGGLLSSRDDVEQVSAWRMYTHVPVVGWRVAVCVRAETGAEIFWYMPELTYFVP